MTKVELIFHDDIPHHLIPIRLEWQLPFIAHQIKMGEKEGDLGVGAGREGNWKVEHS